MANLEGIEATDGPAANEGIHAKEKKSLTKRQRRKQVNDKHKWPEVPKIQSPEVRAKAYVRMAGLTESSDKKINVDLDDPSVRFGRLLGSADQRTRHQAVLALEAYLKQKCEIFDDDEKNMNQPGMSELDMLKLWKALWHTLYMADKVPVQHELSRRLAKLVWCFAGTEEEDEYAGRVYLETYRFDEEDEEEEGENNDNGLLDDEGGEEAGEEDSVTMEEIENTLRAEFDQDESEEDEEGEMEEEDGDVEDESEAQIEDEEDGLDNMEIPHCRGAHLSSLFVRTFLQTVRREWGQMDKYRVDKFYTLMRMMIHEVYSYMSLRHWSRGIVRTFNDVLHEEVLSQTPNGLRYHLIDLAVHELALVNANAPMSLTETTFLDCMEPFFALAAITVGDDTVRVRVMENVVSKFLDYSVVSTNPVKDEEGSILQFDQVHVGSIADYIFQLASDPETSDGHRDALYDMHKNYMRAIKKAGKDVVLDWDQYDEESEDDHAYIRTHEFPDQEIDESDDNKEDSVAKNDLHVNMEQALDVSVDSDALYDGDVDTPERPRKRKNLDREETFKAATDLRGKDGTKTKRKRKKETKGNSRKETQTTESSDATDLNSQIPGEKKKRKKQKEGGYDQQVTTDSADSHADPTDFTKSKRKKISLDSLGESESNFGSSDKKKKKKRKDTASHSEERSSSSTSRGAEEITISVAEQKKARKALKKPNKQGAEEKESDSTPSSERKRVKFGQHVMARSWVNSMAGLHNMQVSPLPPKPEKGILQKRRSHSKVTKVKQRKKAADYF